MLDSPFKALNGYWIVKIAIHFIPKGTHCDPSGKRKFRQNNRKDFEHFSYINRLDKPHFLLG